MLQKLFLYFSTCIAWLYQDSDKAFSSGGVLGAGVMASISGINYLHWLNIIIAAALGGVVNMGIKYLATVILPLAGAMLKWLFTGKNNGKDNFYE